MICYLKGNVLKKFEKTIFLENSGVGYKIKIPTKILNEITENNESEFFIHSHIREDAFDLYGFNTINELNFFETLLSVKGIGPKIALEIVNVDINSIKSAILNKDIGIISSIPGIGKKTAERIVLELKNKVEIDDISNLRPSQGLSNDISDDIMEALLKMGFQRAKIIGTLSKLPDDFKSEEEIISYFLKNA
jgi:holliday junction DNA helicase RuvA